MGAGFAAAMVVAAPAWAATRTWDTTSGNGSQIDNAGGTWNTSTSNWNTGSGNTIWTAGDDAVFGGAGSVGAAGTVTLSGNQTINSLTFNNVPSGNFVFNPSGNEFQYAGTNAITQNSSSAVTINPNFNASNDSAFTLGGNGSGVVTLNGPIIEKNGSHPLSLTKTGSSNFVLTSASNSYSAITNVNGGTLTVNGTLGGGGIFNVNNTAKLAGTGTISKTVNINSGATLSPKDHGTNSNIGTISTDNQTWAGGSTYQWEISNATTAAGSGYDTVNVNGALTISANSGNKMTIKVVSHGPVTGWNPTSVWHWTIATATSNIAALAGNFQLDVTDFLDDNAGDLASFQVDLDATSKQIRVSYVPEPGSTLLLGGMSAVGLLGRRRRRKA
jgi:autotransporter-associated beta strand protein